MKKIFLVLTSAFILISAFSQSKIVNDPNARLRSVRNFHAISVATGIHLYLSQGNDEKIAVSADKPEYIDRIKTELSPGGVLKIYFDNGSKWFSGNNNKNLRVYVSYKTLDAVSGSSGAQVEVDGAIKSGSLALEFSSGAIFSGDVSVGELKLNQGSGSIVNISGSANKLDVEASSGSSMKGFDLHANQCEAIVSSGGSVDITVLKTLSASAHSGGQINYSGGALISQVNTGSGGAVSKR